MSTAKRKSQLAAQVGEALQCYKSGDLVGAELLFLQVLAEDDQYADALHLYGCLKSDQGRLDEAAVLIKRAVSCNGQAYPYHYNLANLLSKQGKLNEAVHHFREAIRIKPDYGIAHNNYGLTLARIGDLAKAKVCYRNAIKLQPDIAEPYYNMGLLLKDEGDLVGAISKYRDAIRLHPQHADAYYSLGNALFESLDFEEAILAYKSACQISPKNSKIHNNFGNALMKLGRLEEAIDHFREVLKLDPNDLLAHSNLITAKFMGFLDPIESYNECRRWEQMHAESMQHEPLSHPNVLDPNRKLRIGYVSPDFRRHPVAYFIETVFSNHDDKHHEIFAYYNYHIDDAITVRMQGYCKQWRNISALDDNQAAELIRKDEIDILIDLAGHTANNALMVFARKPAPIQITWLGYPHSTGLKAIDYRFTDNFADPAGLTEHLNSEELYRLPDVFCSYSPCASQPEKIDDALFDVIETPALKNGYITYGCMNSLSKITPHVIRLWSKLLHADQASKLLLETEGLDSHSMQQRIEHEFACNGVSKERLCLIGRKQEQQYILYHQIDIALDPFPCNGGTTSLDALWMGVPLISLAGNNFVSRMGVSFLTNLGLKELIAFTEEEYINLAISLGSDVEKLNCMRLSMRQKMQNSPLMQTKKFTHSLESAYRNMWKIYVSKKLVSGQCRKN